MQHQALAGEKAIRGVLEEQMRSWNAGDAVRYGQTFATDATSTNVLDDYYSGRDALTARMSEILGTVFKDTRLELTIRNARRVSDDVAILDIDCVVHGCRALPTGMATEAGLLHTAMLQVLVRKADAWLVVAFHNVVKRKIAA